MEHVPLNPAYAVACSAVHEAGIVWLCDSGCTSSRSRADHRGGSRDGPNLRSKMLEATSQASGLTTWVRELRQSNILLQPDPVDAGALLPTGLRLRYFVSSRYHKESALMSSVIATLLLSVEVIDIASLPLASYAQMAVTIIRCCLRTVFVQY